MPRSQLQCGHAHCTNGFVLMGCGKSNPGFGAEGHGFHPAPTTPMEALAAMPVARMSGQTNDTGTTAQPDTGATDNADDDDTDLGGLDADDGGEVTGGYRRDHRAHGLRSWRCGLQFDRHRPSRRSVRLTLYGQNVAITVGNMNVATTVATLEGIDEISQHSGVRFVAFVDTIPMVCNATKHALQRLPAPMATQPY